MPARCGMVGVAIEAHAGRCWRRCGCSPVRAWVRVQLRTAPPPGIVVRPACVNGASAPDVQRSPPPAHAIALWTPCVALCGVVRRCAGITRRVFCGRLAACGEFSRGVNRSMAFVAGRAAMRPPEGPATRPVAAGGFNRKSVLPCMAFEARGAAAVPGGRTRRRHRRPAVRRPPPPRHPQPQHGTTAIRTHHACDAPAMPRQHHTPAVSGQRSQSRASSNRAGWSGW